MLSGGIATLAGLVGLGAFAAEVFSRLEAWTCRLFSGRPWGVGEALSEGAWVLVVGSAPPLLAALAVGGLVATCFAGLQVRPKLLSPRLDRIDPFAGLGKLFRARSLGDLAKGLAGGALLLWVGWTSAEAALPELVRAVTSEAPGGMGRALGALQPGLVRCSGVLFALGIVDYLLARRRHLSDLKMSRDELRREHKEAEGDPTHRAKRKSAHRQLAASAGGRGVKSASVVVVNPTHIAVALRYTEADAAAPLLVAKGKDDEAFHIRSEARRLGIPVVKDIPLARSLVRFEVGEEIPEELYLAAATVIAFAAEQRAALHSRSHR
jgi:type III secretion protein U